MSGKLEKKNKRREKKLSQAIDAGREFRKAIRSLTSVGFDESYIEGFEARLTFDIRVLKKERDRLHGDDVTDAAAETIASATSDAAMPADGPQPTVDTAKPAGPGRASRARKAAAPADQSS